MSTKPTCVALLGLFAVACGDRAAPRETSTSESTQSAEHESSGSDPLEVSGLLGTLSQDEIRGALEPRMMKLSRCVEKRTSSVEWISGALELSFHIGVDGSVANVFPTKSTFGDREAERCMVDVARATRFPKPHGGEADFAWPLEVPLDGSVREPVAWGASEASDLITSSGAAALSACGGGTYAITAYVETDGHVVAAGAATQDKNNAGNLDCIAEQIKTWTFPSPGSYPAKIEFELR